MVCWAVFVEKELLSDDGDRAWGGDITVNCLGTDVELEKGEEELT